ncbi:alpha-E domain-containing protein [Saccharibacillus sp. CPCC 101409]|uniref:alpha-E domain-containing protein n=1 Tax=Saccharibacillus sp. CPCC 101409 TaxID=3058041 RepID=UPI00267204C5|nr:alpha-E domain-containing protein [Saccharibacillus sp. CPCC 101409]MDO3410366.1 alpha-E domain-containing protein [Saccharibacillus sp. CPCC 101409]
MLNRNAEALFWIGRYFERAENHARLIDVHYHIQQTETHDAASSRWSRLVDAIGSRDEYTARHDDFSEEDVLSFLTLDLEHPNSIYACIYQARSNLRMLRQQLPSEMWDAASGFQLWLDEQTPANILEDPHDFYQRLKEQTATFLGIEQSTLWREKEWHLIESGRFLERAENTVRILKSTAVYCRGSDSSRWYPMLQAVLNSLSAYQAFRRRFADDMSPARLLEFLIADPTFPRSALFAFRELEEHLHGLAEDSAQRGQGHRIVLRQTGKIKSHLEYLDYEELDLNRVDPLLDRLIEWCDELGGAMRERYFRSEEIRV